MGPDYRASRGFATGRVGYKLIMDTVTNL